MRGEPHSYQSIAAAMPDPPDYLVDDGDNIIECDDPKCADDAEGTYNDLPFCPRHAREAYEWDRADET